MLYRLTADALVVVHAAFVLFVALGALLVLRWPRAAWVHLPAAVWGSWIELSGRICPLTPMENRLRRMAGEGGYDGGFIEHYLIPAIYPAGLRRGHQIALGLLVVALNVVIYSIVLRRARKRRSAHI
jgi:hypothetical protein